jgi:hypothetical protein
MEGGAERRLPSFGLCIPAYLAIDIASNTCGKNWGLIHYQKYIE